MELTNNEIRDIISLHYLLLSKRDFNEFLSITQYRTYKNKELILSRGKVNPPLFIILKGSARAIDIDKDGTEYNCHLRAAGFLFGDPNVFSEGHNTLDVIAVGNTHILLFNVTELESLAFKNHHIMMFYLAMLKEVISVFSHRIQTFVTMSSEERYNDLIRWNPQYLQDVFDKHLASFLGITPLTIHRIKKKQKDII